MRRSKKYSRPFRPVNDRAIMAGHTQAMGRGGAVYNVVRQEAAPKPYVCPACKNLIAVGEPNVVVWTEDTIWGAQAGIDGRRHWHEWCWKRYSR